MSMQTATKWHSAIKYFALIGLLAIGAVLIWTQLVARGRPATITQVYGTVLVSPANDPEWITARPGQQLNPGDQLFTESQDSGATVVFNDQHIAFRLEADSLATMRAHWNAITQSGSGGLFVSQGTLKAETQDGAPTKQTRFQIDTPVARANVQGTRLIVQVLKGEQTTRISALEGQVSVRARPEHAVLYRSGSSQPEGQEAVISKNETLIVYAESPPIESLPASQHLGRVRDRDTGNGVGGVVVQVAGDPGRHAVSDEAGYFEIPGPTFNEELSMIGATDTVSGDPYLVAQVGQVKGKVENIFDGKSLSGAEIVPLRYPSLAAKSAPDGTFTIEELPAGNHTLLVKMDGYVSAVTEVSVDQAVHVSVGSIPLVPLNGIFNYLPITMKNFTQYP